MGPRPMPSLLLVIFPEEVLAKTGTSLGKACFAAEETQEAVGEGRGDATLSSSLSSSVP